MTLIDKLKELDAAGDKATQDEFAVCHHLKSLEKDKQCPCGYRGGIYGKPDHMVCEMGPTTVEGEEGLEMLRYPREIEMANAAFITTAANSRQTIKEAIERIEQFDEFEENDDEKIAELSAEINCLQNPEDYPDYPNDTYWEQVATIKDLEKLTAGVMEGHDDPCYYCGEPCMSSSGLSITVKSYNGFIVVPPVTLLV